MESRYYRILHTADSELYPVILPRAGGTAGSEATDLIQPSGARRGEADPVPILPPLCGSIASSGDSTG